MTGYTIRSLTAADAALVGRQRAGMLRAMGMLEEAEVPRLVALTEPFVRRLVEQDSYLGFFAAPEEEPTRVVGGVGVWLKPRWPWAEEGKATPPGTQGLVLNVFVDPEHRRRGVARELMLALEGACADRGVAKLTLHATPEGRPLYESLGYEPTNEMSLRERPRRR